MESPFSQTLKLFWLHQRTSNDPLQGRSKNVNYCWFQELFFLTLLWSTGNWTTNFPYADDQHNIIHTLQWQIISFWWNEFQDIIVSAHIEKKITHRTAEQHLDVYKWKLLGKLESLNPEMEKTIKSPSIFKEDLNLIPNHIIVNVKYFCCLWWGLQQA